MSYVVLARKYRPRNFAQMVGQEHVVRALSNALASKRLHHAYLFTGTRGIGKTTVSRILAKSLNCTGPDGQGDVTAEPCGQCPACTEIDADRYMDYIELDAASNRGIDEARDLIERAAYKPAVGRFKVFMIDEAHQLTKDAFSALLKTLEEPPDYLKFVLATTDPERMLPTVLSRCLQFNLRPMAPDTVREYLQTVLDAEQVGWDAGALRIIARAARGSMRDALSLTDQAIAYGGGKLEETVVRSMLGVVDRHQAARLVETLARRDGADLLAAVQVLREHGLSAAGTLEQLVSLTQQMAVEQAVPGALPADDPDADAARTLAPSMAPDETQLLYSLALHGRGELSLAPDEYAGLAMVLLRFLAFPPAGTGAPAVGNRSERAPGRATPETASAALRASRPMARSVSRPAPALPALPPAPAAPVATPATPGSDAARSHAASRGTSSEPPAWLDEVPVDDGAPQAAAPAPAPSVPAMQRAAPARETTAATAPAAIERTALGDRWAELTTSLAQSGAITALARELAMQSELVGVGTDDEAQPAWRLVVDRESLRAQGVRDKLRAAMAHALGHAIHLDVEAGAAQDTPARREAEAHAARQRQAEDTILNDPVVIALMAEFSTARVVPGSIKPI